MPQFALGWALTVFIGVRWLAARLLGVRLTAVAALACAALGVGAGFGLQYAVAANQRGAAPFLTFAILSVLATMGLTATLGLLQRPKRKGLEPRVGRPHPLRALRGRIARMSRYLGILWLVARYGFRPLTAFMRPRDENELGRALHDALQDAGGIFVKFGQQLSARTDLVPPAIALELASLQDNVTPLPAEAVRTTIRAELGSHAEALLVGLDEQPLAAASIAQVHPATLANGDQVVVKVLRPGIENLVENDLDILLRMAAALEEREEWARRVGTVALAQAFADNLHQELDFRIEADNIAAVAAANGGLRTPRVYRELSTRRVLVEERIDGAPLRDASQALTTEQRTLLARSLLHGLLRQIFDTGIFHGDPHAGNVFVDSDGRIALLDFGSVGRLDRLQLPALALALAAVVRHNATELRDALVDLSTTEDAADLDGLERALARFFAERFGPGTKPGAEILNDLVRLVVRYGLAPDPQLAAVFRSLATLDGTLRVIDPTFDIVSEAQRFAEERRLGLPRPTEISRELLDGALELLPTLRKIPRRLDHISAALERGELTVRMRSFADPRDVKLIVQLTNRALLGLFSASIGLVAVLLLRLHGGPTLFDAHIDELLGYGGLIAATILGLRVLVAITHDDR